MRVEAGYMNNIEGKSAIVTGGTRGIGLAIASALLRRGGRIYICGRNRIAVEHTLASLRSAHGEDRVHGTACDVRSYDQVSSLFSDVRQKFGALDILINNAGIGSHNSVEQMAVADLKATLQTHTSRGLSCCHET